jgi:hypothetical protein
MWRYTGGDESMALFSRCVDAWDLPFVDGQRILEIGYNEENWLELMADAYPSATLVGVDVFERPTNHPRVQLFEGNAWDWLPPDGTTGLGDGRSRKEGVS